MLTLVTAICMARAIGDYEVQIEALRHDSFIVREAAVYRLTELVRRYPSIIIPRLLDAHAGADAEVALRTEQVLLASIRKFGTNDLMGLSDWHLKQLSAIPYGDEFRALDGRIRLLTMLVVDAIINADPSQMDRYCSNGIEVQRLDPRESKRHKLALAIVGLNDLVVCYDFPHDKYEESVRRSELAGSIVLTDLVFIIDSNNIRTFFVLDGSYLVRYVFWEAIRSN